MKRLNYILTILLGSLLLAACSQEPTEESSVESQGNLKIDIDTRVSAGEEERNEGKVNTVRVIVFGKQGNWLGRVTCNQLFDVEKLTEGTTTPLIKVRSGLSDIFMVLNEGNHITSAESGVGIDNITSRAQFDALKIASLASTTVGTIAMPMLQSFPDVLIKPYPQTTIVGGAGATGAERLAVKLIVTFKSEVADTKLNNIILTNFNGHTGMKPVDAAIPKPLTYSKHTPVLLTGEPVEQYRIYVPESWVLQEGSTKPMIEVNTTIGDKIGRVDRYQFDTPGIFAQKLFARNSATTINFTIKPRNVEVTTQVQPWGKRSDDIGVGDGAMDDEVKMTTTAEGCDNILVTGDRIAVYGAGTQKLTLRVVDNTKTNIEYTTADGATVSKVLTPDKEYITLTVRSKYTDWAIHPAVDNIATVTIKQGNTTKEIHFDYKPHVIARFTTGNLVQNGDAWKAKVGQPLDGGFHCLYGSVNGYPWHDWMANSQPPAYGANGGYINARKNTVSALPEDRRTTPRGWDAASLLDDRNNSFVDICVSALGGEYRTPTAKEFAELIWGPAGTSDTNLKESQGLKEIRNGGGALLGWAVGPKRESVTFSGGAILNADDPIKNGALFLPAAGQMTRTGEYGESGMGAYMTSSSAATGANIYRLYLSTGNSGVYSQDKDYMGVLRCIRK